MKLTDKQSQVIELMKQGYDFDAAYELTGLSQSYQNKTAFLHRLIGRGALVLVIPQEPGMCYSDHNEDIRTKGYCDFCHGTTPQGES